MIGALGLSPPSCGDDGEDGVGQHDQGRVVAGRACGMINPATAVIAAVGSVGQPQQTTDSPGRLIWLIRLVDGLMAEMWTYQQNQPSR